MILMKNFNSRGQAVPDHLWELALAVRRLIVQYDAMDLWRRRVRGWVMQVSKAAEKPSFAGVDVMYLPLSLESPHIEGKYALLAAVHDECVELPDAEELIHPWASEADFGGPDKVDVDPEVLEAITTYVHLMAHILPDQVGRGIERSKSYRLLDVLRAVSNDVKSAAKVWTPDQSICADELDPVEEYESFLRRDPETEDVRGELTGSKVQKADDLEAPVFDDEQVKPADGQQITVNERRRAELPAPVIKEEPPEEPTEQPDEHQKTTEDPGFRRIEDLITSRLDAVLQAKDALIALGGELSPLEYRIVKHLWDRGSDTVDNIGENCWDKPVTRDAHDRAIKRLRDRLDDLNWNIFLRIKNETVTLDRPDK